MFLRTSTNFTVLARLQKAILFSLFSRNCYRKMNPSLYKAATEGNVDNILAHHVYELDLQITPTNNTLVHVASLFGNTKFVEKAVTLCPSLLSRVNIRNETALHIAAKEGHLDVARVLIECAKTFQEELESGVKLDEKLARMTDIDGDTALHKAVRNGHCEVAKLLVEEDPEFAFLPNKLGETPLYLAAEEGCKDCLFEILNTCALPTYTGPRGRTALHAAVNFNYRGCVEMLLDWKPALCQGVDMYGWTPLHYAALFGHTQIATEILKINKSVAYLATDKDQATALHIAAGQGHTSTMEELLLHCPDCWEAVTGKGQNILHLAIVNENKNVINFILDSPILRYLIGEKDMDGNTPLHLLGISGCFVRRLMEHPRANKMAFNNENLTPLDLAYTDKYSSDWGLIRRTLRKSGRFGLRNVVRDEHDIVAEEKASEIDQKIIESMRKEADTRLIVAALIATVTFTAGFTLPGGYIQEGSDAGMAVLAKKAAFRAFLITDTIALICSTCAVFVYFLKVDFINRHKIVRHYLFAKAFVTISMAAVVIAFITGVAAVLKHASALAVAVGVIGCSSFIFYYYEFRPALRSIRGRPKYMYSEQTKRRGRPTYMIWGTKTPPQKFVGF